MDMVQSLLDSVVEVKTAFALPGSEISSVKRRRWGPCLNIGVARRTEPIFKLIRYYKAMSRRLHMPSLESRLDSGKDRPGMTLFSGGGLASVAGVTYGLGGLA